MEAEFVTTRGARARKNASEEFVAVSYEAPKKKLRGAEDVGQDIASKSITDTPFPGRVGATMDEKKRREKEMKRARYDVIKFGMSGFEGTKAEEAKVTLAVKLGAKPPRNRGKNYKELKLERLRAKEEARKEEKLSGLGKSMAGRRFDGKRRKQSGILDPYGVVQRKDVRPRRNNGGRR